MNKDEKGVQAPAESMAIPFSPASPSEGRRAVVLFGLTLLSVYWVYGWQWMGWDPFRDLDIAIGSAKFAIGLMGILLAHEMGHYLVARRHGFELSLPYFIPFPMAFGTFGAIIRLRSLPANRTALLEMGATGPLAGFVVAIFVMALGLPGTIEQAAPAIEMAWPVEPTEVGGVGVWLVGLLAPFFNALEWLLRHVPFTDLVPEQHADLHHLIVMANPVVMDLLGELMLGAPPSRYAQLDPLAMAGWTGCFLTALNLLPIGQLDGGHILTALSPRWSSWVSRVGIVLAFCGGVLWAGWAFWGFLLVMMRAWMSLPVPEEPALTRRARLVAALAGGTLVLTFMPTPFEVDEKSIAESVLLTPEGDTIPFEEYHRWRHEVFQSMEPDNNQCLLTGEIWVDAQEYDTRDQPEE